MAGVVSINTLEGALTLAAGTGITITPSGGDTLTIAATASGANTALSNLASVAINTALVFGTGVAGAVQSTNTDLSIATLFTGDDFVPGKKISLVTGDTGGASAHTGLIELTTGTATGAAHSGAITLTSGGVATGAGGGPYHSGTIQLLTGSGAAASMNSGDVILQIGTAGGTRGKIKFVDGSEGTSGHVWTSTGTGGEGAWAAAASGGATIALDNLASTAVNADILPASNNSHKVGSTAKQFLEINGQYISSTASPTAPYEYIQIYSSGGNNLESYKDMNITAYSNGGDPPTKITITPDGAQAGGSIILVSETTAIRPGGGNEGLIVFGNVAGDVTQATAHIKTQDGTTTKFSQHLEIKTGNVDVANSGDVYISSGSVNTGTRGKVQLSGSSIETTADVLPNTTKTLSVGTAAAMFDQMHAKTIIAHYGGGLSDGGLVQSLGGDGNSLGMISVDDTLAYYDASSMAWADSTNIYSALVSSEHVAIGPFNGDPYNVYITGAKAFFQGTMRPRVFTTTERDALSGVGAGDMIYNSTLSKLQVYTGAAWQTITSV